FHLHSQDLMQRMLNAMEPGTYVQPHKHERPDKREVFILLTGRVLIVEFNTKGEIHDHVILDHKLGVFAVEIPPRVYHTIVSLKSGSVVYELKDGPYDEKVDKGFASWAPEENSVGTQDYLQNLLNSLCIKVED